MSDDVRTEAAHRRPHAPPMASAFLEFDLTAEIDRLHRESTWAGGRNARTLVKFDDIRIVLSVLRAAMRIPEHTTEGRISVQVLSGRIRLNAAGRTFDLRAGNLLALDQGTPHDVEALEDSAFLLTIAWSGRQEPHTGTP